jgi:two-component system, NarL family, response regulator LiaR
MRGKDAMTIRVLITDDHKVVRRGLRGFLELDPDLEVVGEASNGEEALHLAQRLAPDVVLMDLLMPVMNGIEATGRIRRELPDVEVVALTSVLEDASVTGAVKAGAIGYILKTTDADELCEAIKAAAGQVRLAPEGAARLMREVRVPESPKALTEPLTEREAEVLELIARGKANKQIERELFVALSTVKAHVNNLYRKLNVSSRTQAALYAARIRLVATEEISEESGEGRPRTGQRRRPASRSAARPDRRRLPRRRPAPLARTRARGLRARPRAGGHPGGDAAGARGGRTVGRGPLRLADAAFFGGRGAAYVARDKL